jgi:hypothetical protein
MAREATRRSREGTNVFYACKAVGSGDRAGEGAEGSVGGLRLTGDRNQCRGCGQYFNSTGAFDKHRRGDFTDRTRRCLSTQEMQGSGMQRSRTGFWVGRAFTGQADWWVRRRAA